MARVSLRILFAIWIAVAMAVAPFAMPMGEASAAPAGHHAAMASDAGDVGDAGHCDEQQAPGHSDQDKDKPCCVAGCMAAATLPAMGGEALALPGMSERPGLDMFRRGYLGEIATPPPRLS